MRTLIIIAIGLIMAMLLLNLFPKKYLVMTGIVFCVDWLAAVLWNLKIGLSHGYTLAEELPIHLVLYVIPVAAYWLYFYWFKQ